MTCHRAKKPGLRLKRGATDFFQRGVASSGSLLILVFVYLCLCVCVTLVFGFVLWLVGSPTNQLYVFISWVLGVIKSEFQSCVKCFIIEKYS